MTSRSKRAVPALIASSVFSSTLLSHELPPLYWMENVSATDDSIQTSLVFRTVRGVSYRVEASEDSLSDWEQQHEFYGLGHDIVVPMRQHTAPPPSPPGSPPGGPPPPSVHVSLKVQPASGSSGGTVVSWKSLDTGSHMVANIGTNLHPDWQRVPLYSEHFGDHHFFVWHPMQSAAAPASQPDLGPKDDAMLNQFEASLPERNLQVAAAIEAARNAPPAAPPATGSKKFWRIAADWSQDTDQDGSPDWLEFEIEGNPSHPDHGLANAFNPDVDGNGVPDGKQMDSDEDGVPDANDTAPGNNRIVEQRGLIPRYAVFPVQVPATDSEGSLNVPMEINDRGTVIFHRGVWSNGEWKPLALAAGSLSNCRALATNGAGEIVGTGTLDLPDVSGMRVVVRWPNDSSNPTVVQMGSGSETTYATPTYGFSVRSGPDGRPYFSDDGGLIAINGQVEEDEEGVKTFKHKDRSIWTVPGPGRTAAATTVDLAMVYTQSLNTYWGPTEDKTLAVVNGTTRELANPGVMNIVTPSGGFPHALLSTGYPYILKDGNWAPVALFGEGIDMAEDSTVISGRSSAPLGVIRVDGQWRPLTRMLPAAPAWMKGEAKLLDTTKGGWILANRSGADPAEYLAMLPLRVEGNRTIDGKLEPESSGVDSFSIRSTDPAAVSDKIWIMAPSHGGETMVKVTAPIHSSSPVELSGEGLKFNGNDSSVTLAGPVTTFTLSADTSTVPGSPIPLTIKLGTGANATSISTPISALPMKRRIVKARVWLVRNRQGELPTFGPSKEQLDGYLNKVYGDQINVNFQCTFSSLPFFEWDNGTAAGLQIPAEPGSSIQPGNGVLDVAENNPGEAENIYVTNYVDTMSINIYIIGGISSVSYHTWDSAKNKLTTDIAGGVAFREENIRKILIAGDLLESFDPFFTVAHEIGHFIFGDGHPESHGGAAPLPGTTRSPRLMCSTPQFRDPGARLTVKQEWDAAVEWIEHEIERQRISR